MGGCLGLLGELGEEEAQLRVMGTLLVAAEQMGSLVVDKLGPLWDALPQLWASDSHLLKGHILMLLKIIVQVPAFSSSSPVPRQYDSRAAA